MISPLKIFLEATAITVEPSKYFEIFLSHAWLSRAREGYNPLPIQPVTKDFQSSLLSLLPYKGVKVTSGPLAL